MATATIRVGAASWTDHEPFYPPEYEKASMKSQRISYYARFFSLVEVDSTFYHLQPARNFQMWADRTPDDFVFNVKAYGELTWHHRDDAGVAVTPSAETFAKFHEMVQPMREAGKLGAVLFQFPPWFTYDDERLEYFNTVREVPEVAELLIGSDFGPEVRINAQLVRKYFLNGRVEAAFAFLHADAATYRNLVQLMFSGDHSWSGRKYPSDNVFRSFWTLVTTFWRVSGAEYE